MNTQKKERFSEVDDYRYELAKKAIIADNRYEREFKVIESDNKRNAVVCRMLGLFVNDEKHGIDGKLNLPGNKTAFLEMKNVKINGKAKRKQATFNDMTPERALEFSKDNKFIAVNLWDINDDSGEPICTIFGRSDTGISDYLYEKSVDAQKKGKKRNSPNIGINELIRKYDFKIISKYPFNTVVNKICPSIIDIKNFNSNTNRFMSISDFNINEQLYTASKTKYNEESLF